MNPTEPIAVYVHTPFCPTKCGYCDFNSYAMTGDIVGQTVDAIRTEILRSPWRGQPAKTIFFGGGTPTYLTADQLLSLLYAVIEVHPPTDDCEITSEANPGTVDAEKFAAMRSGGFNRLSLGAQSFVDSDLIRLGRVHQSGEIERAVALSRAAGFDNLNLDLMFGLPGQQLPGWQRNLERALALQPDHLSLYGLTIEPNTAFYREQRRGQLILPEDEEMVAMYDECVARTADAGLAQYEISNFARPGLECRHNLAYWRSEEYAAYGPGAVGRVGRNRYVNVKHPERYVAAVASGGPITCEVDALDASNLRTERIMLGLRLNEGFNPAGLNLDPAVLSDLRSRSWIDDTPTRIRLTPAGRHFCSEVALALI